MPGHMTPKPSYPLSIQKIALVCLAGVDHLQGGKASSNTHLPLPSPTQREFVQNEEGMGGECSQEQSVLRQVTTSPGRF